MYGRTPLADKLPEWAINLKERKLQRVLGITADTLRDWRTLGIPYNKVDSIDWASLVKPEPPKLHAKFSSMAEMHKVGGTLQAIGDAHGVTKERVRQILYQHIDRRFGGYQYRATLSAILKGKEAIAKTNNRHAKWELIFRCDWDTIIEINGEEWPACIRNVKAPATAYFQQRRNAIENRGIGWNITFPEWWKVWSDSGKWHKRGRGQGYCMTRIGDTGPYEVGNVEIQTIGENFSESFYKHPAKERFPNGPFGGKYQWRS